jgi:hypothetical protein
MDLYNEEFAKTQKEEEPMKNARWIVIGTEIATNKKLLKYATVLVQEHFITPNIISRYTIIQRLFKSVLSILREYFKGLTVQSRIYLYFNLEWQGDFSSW